MFGYGHPEGSGLSGILIHNNLSGKTILQDNVLYEHLGKALSLQARGGGDILDKLSKFVHHY
jgi:hypothetical protein